MIPVPLKIAITSGDTDGIGPEVTAKALLPQKGVQFYLWRSDSFPQKYLSKIDESFKRHAAGDWEEAKILGKLHTSSNDLIDITSEEAPPIWVEKAALASLSKELDGIVTAPLSKTGIIAAGLNDIGHTEILARTSKSSDLFMTFLGNKFNVLLATGHIPLNQINSKLDSDLLIKAIKTAYSVRSTLPETKKSLPIALVGIDPHAGEQGIVGTIDEALLTPTINRLQVEGLQIVGPLVPDAAFLKKNWNKYSIYVCCYHDQGLIPFKMIHGQDSGVHITSGLDFVRTSVDHGTAKDIYMKDIANPNSMTQAIDWAVKLTKKTLT